MLTAPRTAHALKQQAARTGQRHQDRATSLLIFLSGRYHFWFAAEERSLNSLRVLVGISEILLYRVASASNWALCKTVCASHGLCGREGRVHTHTESSRRPNRGAHSLRGHPQAELWQREALQNEPNKSRARTRSQPASTPEQVLRRAAKSSAVPPRSFSRAREPLPFLRCSSIRLVASSARAG